MIGFLYFAQIYRVFYIIFLCFKVGGSRFQLWKESLQWAALIILYLVIYGVMVAKIVGEPAHVLA